MARDFAVLITIIAMIIAPSSASLVTFIFGDSLTEVGNNNYLQLSLAKSNFPYYGIDFKGGKATGRFTNGRTIGDIISAKLGIEPPPPYLSLSQNDDAILKGVNYASGGAGILNDTGLYFIQRLSFDDQIMKFEKTKESIKAKIGEEGANKLCSEAVFFIGLEALPTWCKKNGLPRARATRMHSIPKGEIKERRMPKTNTYPVVLDLIENPTAYGFKVSNTSCCKVDTQVGGLCLPNSKLCSNRSDYVFWDAFHPSDAANVVLANTFFDSLFSNSSSPSPSPSPSPLPSH
ncbi:hypothetical protein RD792_013149 [Penstemon davidsonii]|uniref:GDSL esterase/lipase n=1 Tax=Penstemon davidsonii TaxID=160366 RepID=A0ABR0CT64_9LAMI|nr:hypothetical protein RD792_013149 [Penstemon davidsonii]